MPVDIPRTKRLANPRLDGSGRALAVLGISGGLAAAMLLGQAGLPIGLVSVLLGVSAAHRRRTVGAYEGYEGLVVRNWFATHDLAWPGVERVESRRDPWFPWFRVPVVVHAGGSLPVSALRHRRASAPVTAHTLTKIVRDRRDERTRWN
jgi:hypothetical protein